MVALCLSPEQILIGFLVMFAVFLGIPALIIYLGVKLWRKTKFPYNLP